MNKKLIVSFILALLLSITPLPSWSEPYRPMFVALLTVFWAIYHGNTFGLGSAFIIGLFLDVLHTTLLGQNSLCLVAITSACIYYRRSFQMAPIFQQIVFVLAFCLLYQFLFIWVDSINNRALTLKPRLIMALISALLWPAIIIIMNYNFANLIKKDKEKH